MSSPSHPRPSYVVERCGDRPVASTFVIETANVAAFSTGKFHLIQCRSDIVLLQELSTLQDQVPQRAGQVYAWGRFSFWAPSRQTALQGVSSGVATCALRRLTCWEETGLGSIVYPHRVLCTFACCASLGQLQYTVVTLLPASASKRKT